MHLRRLRAGELIAAACGVALLVSLFLPWYEDVPDTAGRFVRGWTAYAPIAAATALSGWESLAVIDILLALIGAAAVLLAAVTASQSTPAVPIAYSALLTIAAVAGAVLVLFRVVDLPEGAGERDWALWLGLAGALGIAAGSALAMRDERLSPPGRTLDLTGRPTPPPPEIEVIPAPRPEGGS